MENTREHILKTAAGLFLQKGYKEVTMRELVEKSGMSKGAFYHYFSGKDKLFLEIIEFYFRALLNFNYDALSKNSLYDFYAGYLELGEKEGKNLFKDWEDVAVIGETNVYNLMFDAINIFPPFRERLVKLGEIELKAWMNIIKNARSSGEIESVMSDEQIARVFIRTSDGVGLHLVIYGRFNELWEELRSIWDGFYRSLKK